ncbi:MAG: hypothetical protein ACLQGV_17870 [Bryobacteraceae bacterium]
MKNPAKDFEEEMRKRGADPERWEAVFLASAHSRGYKMHIENAMRQSGQAGVAAVDLNRWGTC